MVQTAMLCDKTVKALEIADILNRLVSVRNYLGRLIGLRMRDEKCCRRNVF